MRKDPTKFRERFKRWKNGEKVYDKGTPITPSQDKLDSLLDADYQGPWGTYGYTTDDVSRRRLQRTLARNNKIADRLQAGADAIMLGTGLVPGGQIPSSAYFGARGVGNITQGDYVGGAIDAGLSLVGPAVHLNRQMRKPTTLRSYFESDPQSLRRYDLQQYPEGRLLSTFWNEDVVPRMKKALKDEGVIRPSSSNRWFDNNFVSTRNIRVGEAPTNLRGKGYSEGINNVVFNTNSNLWRDPNLRYEAFAHELHHSQRANLERKKLLYAGRSGEYTLAEQDALNDAYNFSDEFITKYSPLQLQEKGAVNTQTRAAISRMNGGVTGKQLDKAIDTIPDNELTDIIKNGSSYGKDFVASPTYNTKNVRKALRYVGTVFPVPFGIQFGFKEYKDGKDGGPLDGVTGESQTINQETQRAYNFINTYLKSEGFKQRFENNYRYAFAANPIPTFKIPKVIYRNSVPPHAESEKRTIFIPTDEETNKIHLNGRDPYEVYNTHGFTDFPYQGTVTHEMAHVLDYDMARKMQPKHWYTKLFMPVSRMYSAAYEQLTPKTKEGKLNDHDKQRSENYADLIEFRQLLYDNGIYDSTKKNNPFTKEHLKSAKEKLKDIFVRSFNTFSDDELINIMNTVADARVKKVNLSNVESYNGLLLAQNGKDPTYNTQQSYLPEVTISAKRTNYTPTYGYWDSLGQQWSTFNNLGQRVYRGAGWEPDVVLKTPLEYENYRQAQWKKADPNRTYEFSDLIRGIADAALWAAAPGDALSELTSKYIISPVISKTVPKLMSKNIGNNMFHFGPSAIIGGITGGKLGYESGKKAEERRGRNNTWLPKFMGMIGAAAGATLGIGASGIFRDTVIPNLTKLKFARSITGSTLMDALARPYDFTKLAVQGKYPFTRALYANQVRNLYKVRDDALNFVLPQLPYERELPRTVGYSYKTFDPDALGEYDQIQNLVRNRLRIDPASKIVPSGYNGNLAHEYLHFIQSNYNVLNDAMPGDDYYVLDPTSLMYDTYKPLSANRMRGNNGAWIKSPNEFDSEITKHLFIANQSPFHMLNRDDVLKLAKRFNITETQAENMVRYNIAKRVMYSTEPDFSFTFKVNSNDWKFSSPYANEQYISDKDIGTFRQLWSSYRKY